MTQEKRIFGLDLLRVTAVLFVIFHHSLDFVQPNLWLRAFGRLGSLGVEFLLILTGYLIGHSLLKKLRKDNLTALQIRDFYFRRWSRTLPPYYFFLLIMATISPCFILQLWEHKEYFLFLQNFAWTTPEFYGQTWTLAVQEFFYIICPLVLLAGALVFRKSRLAFWVPVLLLLAVPLIVRMFHTHIEDAKGFDHIFRQVVIFRLDSPVIGVIAAFVEVELPGVWAWILHRAWLGAGLFAIVATYYLADFPGLFISHWAQVFFFPVISICVALLFPFLCNWKENTSRTADSVRFVSNMTYTIYVSHYVAFHFGFLFLLFYPVHSLFISYVIYFLFIGAIAYPSYLLVEAPLMRLRNGEEQTGYIVGFYRWTFGIIRNLGEALDIPNFGKKWIS